MDKEEFGDEWDEAIDGYDDVSVDMTGSWEEDHEKGFHYMVTHRFVKYEFVGDDNVKLISDDGSSITVPLYQVSGF